MGVASRSGGADRSVRPKINPPDGFSLLLLQKTAGFANGFLRYISGKKQEFTF
jgi:hypothetical protein